MHRQNKKERKLFALFELTSIRNQSYPDLDQRGDFHLKHQSFPYLLLLIQNQIYLRFQ